MSGDLNVVSRQFFPVVVDDNSSARHKMVLDSTELRSPYETCREVSMSSLSQCFVHFFMSYSTIDAIAQAADSGKIMFDSDGNTCPLESV